MRSNFRKTPYLSSSGPSIRKTGAMRKKADLFGFADLIHSESPISRAGLAEKTNHAPSYITHLTRRLQSRGWLIEGSHAPSKSGRRRVLLHFNPDIAHMIGVQIGRVHCRVVTTDFLGKALSFRRVASECSCGREYVMNIVHREIRHCLAQDPLIRGIGIAHSGVIDHGNGVVLLWHKAMGWRDVPLREIIRQEYGLTTLVEDSSRTLAIAEQRLGFGRGQRNFVCVHAGTGIGAAVFVDGQLYSGNDGLAGELGHTTIDEDGELCSCGNRGCLEVYASGWAIIQKVRKALEEGVSSSLAEFAAQGSENLSIEIIAAAAEAHDRLCERVLAEAGTHLGTALANLVNLLNPARIVLGGALPRVAKGLLLEPLLLSLRGRAFPRSASRLEVMVSELGEDAVAVGACLMTTRHILRDLCTAAETPAGVLTP